VLSLNALLAAAHPGRLPAGAQFLDALVHRHRCGLPVMP
jgi:hypothetical protein